MYFLVSDTPGWVPAFVVEYAKQPKKIFPENQKLTTPRQFYD